MKKLFLIFFLFTSGSVYLQTHFQVEPTIRVKIINSIDTLKISFDGEWTLKGDSISMHFPGDHGELVFIVENGNTKIIKTDDQFNLYSKKIIFYSTDGTCTLKIKNVPVGVGWWWESREERAYEGEFHIYVNDEGRFDVVINLPLEKYLQGVVPNEMGSNSPLEALKAQAVAARSETIMALNSRLHGGENYDFTSGVEFQVFGGNNKRTPGSDSAVLETRGLILSEDGIQINAYYASNCGGHSELIKNVWFDRPVRESYNISHPDWEDSISFDLSAEENVRKWIFSNPPSFCNPDINIDLPDWSRNNFRWKRDFKFSEMNKINLGSDSMGNLIDIKVIKRGTSGRIFHAKFIYEKDSTEILGELNIRRMFDPPLRSSCFVLDKTEDGLTFYGAGWGHGVGMCQSGAITMANRGYNFEEILMHYYRKADLIKAY